MMGTRPKRHSFVISRRYQPKRTAFRGEDRQRSKKIYLVMIAIWPPISQSSSDRPSVVIMYRP
jgi:hypothetical protein